MRINCPFIVFMNREFLGVYVREFTNKDVRYKSYDGDPEADSEGNILEVTINEPGYNNLKFAMATSAALSLSNELTSDGVMYLAIYPPGVEAESLGETVQDIAVNVTAWGNVYLDVLRDDGSRYEVRLPMKEIKQHFEGR